MHDLNSGVFEHLEIAATLDVDQRVNYMQRLLRGSAIKKYKTVLKECKESVKDISGYHWALGKAKYVTMGQFYTWEKVYGIDNDGDANLGVDKCINFEKEIWFDLGDIIVYILDVIL